MAISKTALDAFIQKLANSQNPLIQGLGSELQGLNVLPQGGAPLSQQSVEKDFSVDSDLAQGTDTDTKKNDEIDQLLTTQMPELSDKNDQTANQTRFATAKIATYRDVLRARTRK